jgi:hypothetical protein
MRPRQGDGRTAGDAWGRWSAPPLGMARGMASGLAIAVLMVLVALLSACTKSQQQYAGIGAGAGAAVGAVASPAVAGGVLVGAAAGSLVSLAIHEATTPAPAGPNAIVLRQLLQEQARLWNLSDPILTNNAEVCRDRTRPSFGFVAWTRWDIDRQYRIASMDNYGLDDRLRVVHVLPGSPAAAAGLQAGDEIENVAQHDMPAGKSAGAALGLVLQRESVVGQAQSFRIRRGDQHRTLEIAPRRQCDIDLVVIDSDQVNAITHRGTIYVTDELMLHYSDDRELAAVVAHFLGHVLLDPEAGGDVQSLAAKLEAQSATVRQAALGETERDRMKQTGTLPGDMPYSTKEEIQADRAALELLARAGYSMEALVEVWQDLGEDESAALPLVHFHPPSEERRAAAEDILRQVRGSDETGTGEPGS